MVFQKGITNKENVTRKSQLECGFVQGQWLRRKSKRNAGLSHDS